MRKTIKVSLTIFFILFFYLSPIFSNIAFRQISLADEDLWQDYENYIVIDQNTTWNGHIVYNNPEKPVVLVNGATLTIEKGTNIELLELYVFDGKIIAEGTESEKITFTEAVPDFSNFPPDFDIECSPYQQYGLIEFNDWVENDSKTPSFFRYVEFNNMGTHKLLDDSHCGFTMKNKRKKSHLFNAAFAGENLYYNPALRLRSGRLHIENSEFKNNSYADIEVEMENHDDQPMNYLQVVNSNFSGNQQNTALISQSQIFFNGGEDPIHDKTRILFQNNWYGEPGGPRTEPEYMMGGEKISGDYMLEGYRNKNLIADPAIIIPGIMGSAKVGSLQALDPILHTYANLISSFKENGYEENINLFEFPYEWRDSNIITAENLKNQIDSVKNNTGVSRVDLVAHSMGGLVARYYIESESYQNDIDQLITLGTPHKGAPKSYLTWEAGETGIKFEDKIIKKFFELEAHALGYDNLQDYIQSRVKSVQELLPDYDYLEEANNGETRDYPDDYPLNTFLEFLNDQDKVENLNAVNFINIIGDTDDDATIAKFRVVDSTIPGSWEHGMPENFYDNSTDRGIKLEAGDGTVPLFSAEGIEADEEIKLDSKHSNLPTEAQCKIIQELTGKNDCDYVGTFERTAHILTFGVFSPIDIQVVDPDGNRAGKDFAAGGIINEISGAYYTGHNADTEFLTIPNPQDGEYKILTQGTGEGDYRIEISNISEDEDNPAEAEESTVEITGAAQTSIVEEKKIEVRKNNIVVENSDTVPPAIEIISPENKKYSNNQILPVNYAVKDNISPADKIIFAIYYDGNKFTRNAIDLSLEHLGNHAIRITARDEAGNESEKSAEFNIATDLSAIQNNVNHYRQLGLIKNKKTEEYLERHLIFLEKRLELVEKIKNNNKIPAFAQGKIIQNLKKQINFQIDFLIRRIGKNKNDSLDPQCREILIESLEFVKL